MSESETRDHAPAPWTWQERAQRVAAGFGVGVAVGVARSVDDTWALVVSSVLALVVARLVEAWQRLNRAQRLIEKWRTTLEGDRG